MRKFLFCLVAIFFLSSCKKVEITAVTLKRGPFLTHLSSSSVSIVFEVEEAVEGAEISYGTSPSSLSKRRSGRVQSAEYGDIKVFTVHINIEGLEPDTTYFYKLKSRNSSEVFSFRTYPENMTSFNFVVFGDNRTDLNTFRKLVSLIELENPLFIIHTGDAVDTGFLYSGMNALVGWEEFLDTLIPIMAKSPLYFSFGNHERGGEMFFTAYFPSAEADGSPFYYYFSVGGIFFIILNSEGDLSPSGEQVMWLEDVLSSEKARDASFRVAVIHRPPYSSSEHAQMAAEGREEEIIKIRENFVPLFERGGIDIVFSGHEHNYERTFPILDGKIDEGGVVYIITGGGGAPLYDKKLENPWSACFAKVYHYVSVNAAQEELQLEAKDMEGRIIDEFKLRR